VKHHGPFVTLGAVLITLSCSAERSPSAGVGPGLRSEAAKLVLPREPATLAAALGVPVESLLVAAQERYGRQAYDSAAEILRVEITRTNTARDAPAQARARMWLGMASWRLGDYDAARREGEKSLAMKRELHLVPEMSRSFNALGLLAWNEGRHRNALMMLDSALAYARTTNDAEGVARAAGNIPLVKVELGDFDGARRGFEAAFSAARKVGDDRAEGNDLANLAMLDIRLGDATASLSLLQQARSHYATIHYETGESNALGQLATAWSEMGDLQHAIADADSGLAIARSQGERQEVAATLEVTADLYAQAGNTKFALQRLLQADSLDAALGLSVERGTNLRRVAIILLETGNPSASIARSREALSLHKKGEARAESIYDRLSLASALSNIGDRHAALAEADSAMSDAALVHSKAALRDGAMVSARLALDAKDPRGALGKLGVADTSRRSPDWITPDLRAEALLSLGRLDEATSQGELSIARLERERATLGIGPLRSGFLASRSAPYSHLVAIYLARHDTASAFRVAASLPGRSLAERVSGGLVGAGAVTFVAEGERLLLRSAALEGALAKLGAAPEDREQEAAIEHALQLVRSQYEEHLAHSPMTGSGLSGDVAPTLSEIRAKLPKGVGVLLFLSGPERIDAFLIRNDGITETSVAAGQIPLAARVRVARDLITRARPGPEAITALGDLHELLLGGFTRSGSLDGIGRLLIIPHGSLTALPFGALWDRSRGRFLIEDRSITYSPAISSLLPSINPSRISASGTLILAPLAATLPGTVREANAIMRLIPNAKAEIGAQSSEASARTALRLGKPLHIASHGIHNAQNPLFSRVTVGLDRSGSSSNDGYLEVHEILGLTTTSPLVYLSGCETALGSSAQNSFSSGSDENSIAHAFLVAGAGSVVATLWQVDDAGAVQIADSFYRGVGSGRSPEEALARAQREAINAGRSFTWAAYTISGSGTRKP
jgi:CHAT domain-containing protein/tetratricopeptide (TPR) repeat protein